MLRKVPVTLCVTAGKLEITQIINNLRFISTTSVSVADGRHFEDIQGGAFMDVGYVVVDTTFLKSTT